MKKLWIAAAVLVLLVVAVLAAALVFVRPDQLRPVLESTLEDALGRDVTLGKLELSLLPLPALRLEEVRIAGVNEKAKPFAEVESVRIRLAILPLLVGRIGLASLDVERPRLSMPVDRRGRPVLPGPKETPGATPKEGEPTPKASESGALLLAIDRVRLHQASAEVGPYRVEALDADGSLSPGGALRADFSFDLPKAGRVRGGHVEIDDVQASELVAEVDAKLEEGDLAALAQLAELGEGYAGRVDAEVEGLRVRAGQPEAGKLRAHGRDLALVVGDVAIGGEASAEAALGGDYRIDLGDAEIKSGGVTRKPRGLELAVSGKTPTFPLREVDGVLAFAGTPIRFGAQRLRADAWAANFAPFELDLERARPVIGVPLSGHLSADSLHFSYPPPLVIGDTRVKGGRYPLEQGEVSFEGDVTLAGARIIGRPLRIGIGGQTVESTVTLFLQSMTVEAVASASTLDLEALAGALVGSKDVAGTLGFESTGELSLEKPLESAVGRGHFEISPGRIRGFSLARQTFGEFAALPVLVQALRGRDLSRFEEEEFQTLSADYTVRDGFAHTDNLRLVYRNAVADLHGKVGLADGALDLAGKVTLSGDVDRELGGSGAAPRVIPISGIGGTVASPRVRLDAKAASAAASAYLGSGRVAEEIDEKLGPGAAEAVEGLLDVLRGGKPPEEKQPQP